MRREQVRHPLDGFGYLIPRKSGRATLGTVWNSSLFPGRAPEQHVVITSFLGGATNAQMAGWSDGEVASRAELDATGILGISGAPLVRNVKRYAHALPQFNLGHSQRIAALRGEAGSIPGLFFAGNYLDGPSISSTVESALRTAESAAQL
jgi:oxygen-dependent protoporphyrinogen oxidase